MKSKQKISQIQQIKSKSFLYKIQEYEPQNLAETLSFMLIRPPRFIYNEQLLIPSHKLKDKFDYQTYSIPFPLSLYSTSNMKYVILYLHGNSSSRFQGYMQLSNLPQGVGLACFDFNGCGLREENQFITLGKNQSSEVNIAARFLKGLGYRVVGWGRSMGSVGLIMSEQCDIMIADSPFASLSQLCRQSSLGFLPRVCCCFFHCFYPCVQCWIRGLVQQRTGMDPKQLQVIEYVRRMPGHKSLMIIAGEQDSMIRSHHSQVLYQHFEGKNKKLLLFEGSHNSNRPHSILKQCFQFIHEALGIQIDLSDYPPNKIKTKIRKLDPLPVLIKTGEQELSSNELKCFRYDQLKRNNNSLVKSNRELDDVAEELPVINSTQIKIIEVSSRHPRIDQTSKIQQEQQSKEGLIDMIQK